ncbi:retrovirus-related pol polyprotein from transposon TNT 1-94 [Tanacetum coccineum]
MSTDKESSAAGTDNRPPMLVESDYESWKIRIERYIRGKTLGKLIWRSIQNGPTPHPQITVTEGQGEDAVQVTRDKRDEEFTKIENNKELADIQATNILSQGLPRHVFNILNQTRTGKEIWDNVELLMKGSGKSLQQQKEELFDEYERFRAIGNESIHDYFVRFHKLINDMKITRLNITNYQYEHQRRAPGNVGNPGNRGTQNYGQMTENVGKKVICYNCRGEGHVSRQCKEKKRVNVRSTSWTRMWLIYVTAPYDQPLAITTTNMFEVSHEDAYDSNVDEGPHTAAAVFALFLWRGEQKARGRSRRTGNYMISGALDLRVVEESRALTPSPSLVLSLPLTFIHKWKEPMVQTSSQVNEEEHLDSDVESDIDDNTILYHQYQLDNDVQDVPTEEQRPWFRTPYRAELRRCKQEMVSLERNKVKRDLDQTIIQCSKRNAELEEENVVSEKKVLEDKYLEEIVCLKSANKVATDILQRFQQPTQTIPMLTKRPNLATHDLHKKALGRSNPWNLKQAKLSQPTLYDGHALLNPTHTSVKVHDSEDSLVHAEKELSREQVYWLPAEELATQISNPPKPVTPFVRTRPAKSQISTCLRGLNSWIPAFAHVIDQRTDPCRYPSGSGEFKPVKAMFTEQIIPFYENVKQLVQKLNENIVTEVTEYMRIFDELDTEYERCVLANKNLKIERKNLLIQNDCLIANCLEKDICSIVLASDIVVPPSSNCLCEELRSNCDREHSKVVELEAEILKKQQMLNESEKRCAFIEKNHVNLQVKFQKYKECLQNQRVCDNSNSTASNEIFEINKLKDQLQGKDDTIRNLQTQINITRMLNVGSTVAEKGMCIDTMYEDTLSKSNAYSRSTFTATINALTAENDKLKTELSGKMSSGFTAFCEETQCTCFRMSIQQFKVRSTPKRANGLKTNPFCSKKKHVTFQEPPRTLNRPTQKPPVQQNKKPNVPMNLSTRTKPATESRKPMSKSHTRNHHILPSKSVNARRVADHNRKLNVVDHNQFMIPWRPTRKVVGSVKPQWKPTGRHFALYDSCPLTRIMEPIVEPLELTLSVSSSSKVTMISRSKGRTVADSIAERLTRPTAYKFKTDCSIIPVWECEGMRCCSLEGIRLEIYFIYLSLDNIIVENGTRLTNTYMSLMRAMRHFISFEILVKTLF